MDQASPKIKELELKIGDREQQIEKLQKERDQLQIEIRKRESSTTPPIVKATILPSPHDSINSSRDRSLLLFKLDDLEKMTNELLDNDEDEWDWTI